MRKPKPPSLVTIAIMTTVTIILWIFFDVYRILAKEAQVNVSSKLLKPVTPDLDTNTLAQIAQKVYFERGETNKFSVQEVSVEEGGDEATRSAKVDVVEIVAEEAEESTPSAEATASAETEE